MLLAEISGGEVLFIFVVIALALIVWINHLTAKIINEEPDLPGVIDEEDDKDSDR